MMDRMSVECPQGLVDKNWPEATPATFTDFSGVILEPILHTMGRAGHGTGHTHALGARHALN